MGILGTSGKEVSVKGTVLLNQLARKLSKVAKKSP
jgi:hypothetical protein